ncbi:MAG: CcdB family protein [Burkholderiales bacterium]|nr:CcdB family protein [Burkholderiales bacterium]
MARFDVYANPAGTGYLLDVQADLLSQLNTRVVVPMPPRDLAPVPAARLNPEFEIQGVRCVLATQFMAAIPRSELKIVVTSLEREAGAILGAIDFLHQGW